MRDPIRNLDTGEERVEVELQWDESFFYVDIFIWANMTLIMRGLKIKKTVRASQPEWNILGFNHFSNISIPKTPRA